VANTSGEIIRAALERQWFRAGSDLHPRMAPVRERTLPD
jgi:hypothetical protein